MEKNTSILKWPLQISPISLQAGLTACFILILLRGHADKTQGERWYKACTNTCNRTAISCNMLSPCNKNLGSGNRECS